MSDTDPLSHTHKVSVRVGALHGLHDSLQSQVWAEDVVLFSAFKRKITYDLLAIVLLSETLSSAFLGWPPVEGGHLLFQLEQVTSYLSVLASTLV